MGNYPSVQPHINTPYIIPNPNPNFIFLSTTTPILTPTPKIPIYDDDTPWHPDY